MFPLHSRYDPLREARQTLKKFDYAGADYFILLGIGLGYILDALIAENADASNHYFIVESDIEILRAAFEARDLKSILDHPNLHFAWPPSGPALAEQWQKFFDPVHARKSVFIAHNPSVVLDAALFKAAAAMIQSQTFQIFTDINTLVDKSQIFLNNFVQNLPRAALSPGVAKFTGIFSGVPAVIVSAGPSLDKNLHELRRWTRHALILSTDTALKPLLTAGIDPHFVLTGDPSASNYRHLRGASTKEALFVAEATAFPAIFNEFEGRTIACIFENSSLHSLSDLLGNKGTLRAWGSVATMALDFALLLQCNPIIFIGQDLAHTDGQLYCSGLCFEEEWFPGILDPTEWRNRLARLRTERQTVTVEDIFGRPIESTDKLTAYWNWMTKVFLDHPDVHFINATEGGMLRQNVAILSLREALHRYGEKNLDLSNRIRNAFNNAREYSLLYPSVNLSVLVGEMAAIQKNLEHGLQLCASGCGGSAEILMKRLEAIKDSIYYNPHLAPLLDCLNQMGNVTFLRKRKDIFQGSARQNMLSNIMNTYAQYFISVREALDKIEKAVQQIGSNFHIEKLRKPVITHHQHAINPYSNSPKLPIS